ncbi:MAG: sulfotransferase [Actinomycetota bacterium]|nr:sulfotransferase [Actinomycetota bacterium]
MRVRRIRTPKLDFIVIGAQKAGTTSLWRYLEDNPGLVMPPDKEASFFSEPHWAEDRAFMMAIYKHAPRGKLLGKVTPAYMTGTPAASVATIAERIHSTVPQARLVALLRDPVERAFSAHRMWIQLGEEDRSFEQAVDDLLAPEALERGRRGPSIRDSYVVSGEYGRMLRAYARHFDPAQLHVELTDDLERAPGEVVERVCRHIGVDPHTPARLGERHNAGGRPRVSEKAEGELKEYLDRNVWPRLKHPDQHRNHFQQWFLYWNAEPGPPAPAPPIDERTAARLREHYAEDARILEDALGLRVPWA